MTFLSAWTLSVAGIVVIAQLVDIILPDGQTAKYIKSVIAVIIVCVLIQPISAIKEIDLIGDNTTVMAIDQYYLDSIYLSKVEQTEKAVLDTITEINADFTATVICSRHENNPKIDYVVVNTTKSEINGEKNIQFKEQVILALCEKHNLTESQIWFYES